MKRNVILSFASGYDLSMIEPFVTTWLEHVPSAELVLFADTAHDCLYAAAERFGIVILAPPALRDYPLVIARSFVFRDFLATHRHNVDQVLLSDSRDVLFQSDPFAVPRERSVSFATEDETVEGCTWNRYWVQMVYGGEIRAAMAGQPICCAGTTIGTIDGVLAYLDLMCDESDTRDREHGDQCYHNYIAHVLRPDFVAVDHDDRIVQTIGQTPRERIAYRRHRISVDGHAAPVVHQYDRHADLDRQIRDYQRVRRLAPAPTRFGRVRDWARRLR